MSISALILFTPKSEWIELSVPDRIKWLQDRISGLREYDLGTEKNRLAWSQIAGNDIITEWHFQDRAALNGLEKQMNRDDVTRFFLVRPILPPTPVDDDSIVIAPFIAFGSA
jgi:hypothetical protein